MVPFFLVLTNLSATAAQAARYAAVLGSPLHVHLALLNLYHDALLDPDLVTITTDKAYRSQAEIAATLRTLAERLPTPTEVEVSTDELPVAVAGAVHRFHPLLLVMGLRHEHDVLEHLVLNQALPALRATHRPLLLVPEAIELPCVPRRVVVAVDAEPFVPSAVTRCLAPLLAAWQAAYTVVHVAARHEHETWPGQLVLNQVRASSLLPADAQVQLCYVPHRISPVEGIQHALSMIQPDLLILLVRPRSLLGRLFHRSVTAQVLHQCPVPVLLLPTEAAE